MESDLALLEDPACWPYPVLPLVSRYYHSKHPHYNAIIFPQETTVYFGNLFEVLAKTGDWKSYAKKLPCKDFDSLKDIARMYVVDI